MARRLRRRPNIKATLCQCVVFAVYHTQSIHVHVSTCVFVLWEVIGDPQHFTSF